jgi:hypothetical protein
MRKLKVSLTNKFNDIQYMESDDGNVDIQSLQDNQTWAILRPSEECVHFLQTHIPNSGLRIFKGVTYLLSPKAIQYFVTETAYSETIIISFDTVHPNETPERELSFILFQSPNKSVFENVLALRNKEIHPPKQAILQMVETMLGIQLAPSELISKGWWTLKRHYNPIINLETLIYTNVYYAHVSQTCIRGILNHCCQEEHHEKPGVTAINLDAINLDANQIISGSSHSPSHNILLISRKMLLDPTSEYFKKIALVHREALLRLLGTQYRRVHIIKSFCIQPLE